MADFQLFKEFYVSVRIRNYARKIISLLSRNNKRKNPIFSLENVVGRIRKSKKTKFTSRNTLKHIDYIIAEINREELYKNCSQISDLKEFLSEYGFELVEEAWVGGNWGDGLFIKKK
jgi:hypothetical protein